MMDRMISFFVNLMQPDLQARTVIHYGGHSDWITDIMSYGISPDIIPINQNYKLKTKNHLEYLAMRMRAEEILAQQPAIVRPEQLIDLPSRKDVLLGKGRPIQFSSGNQGLSAIVDGYLDQYHMQSSKLEKTALAASIVQMVQANGVRFLSKESGIWMAVSDEVAREKVSHMFRHQQHKKKSTPGTLRKASDEVPSLSSDANEQSKRARPE